MQHMDITQLYIKLETISIWKRAIPYPPQALFHKNMQQTTQGKLSTVQPLHSFTGVRDNVIIKVTKCFCRPSSFTQCQDIIHTSSISLSCDLHCCIVGFVVKETVIAANDMEEINHLLVALECLSRTCRNLMNIIILDFSSFINTTHIIAILHR